MGAGRKTETVYVGDKITGATGNSFVIPRNLRKSDLGGVIFGCKNNTMTECLSKNLFGLPSVHFSYVCNIEPGLPLFLFNYSDRKMHGIYEAASIGQMSADAYAWTDGGFERTPFPAQVRIRLRKPCSPLTESQFKKVIEDNYYTNHHFWFELDHAQTRSLISLFKSSPPAKTMLAPIPVTSSEPFLPVVPTPKWKPIGVQEHLNPDNSMPIKNIKPSVNLMDENKYASLSLGDDDTDRASSTKTSSTVLEDTECKEPVSDWEDWTEDNLQVSFSGINNHLDEENRTLQKQHSGNHELESEEEMVLRYMKEMTAQHKSPNESSNAVVGNGIVTADNVHENGVQVIIEPSFSLKKEDSSTASDFHGNSSLAHGKAEVQENSACYDVEVAENSTSTTVNYENTQISQTLKQLLERTAILEEQQVESDREMQQLRQLVKDSGRKIQMLNDRVMELELKIDPSIAIVDDSLNKFVERYFGSEDVIYLIGGYNGSSWLSAFDSFSPSLDILTPLKPMSYARSYASAVALEGILYVFGGGDGSLWYNTVECYNRRLDEWTACPPMVREKGSLAGATLNGKIFVIGGGDGIECFSDVEMFDPALGKWIYNQSMLHKRFAPAAAELHGALYTTGGYDGTNYLQSAERCDPREGYWTRLPNMNIRRGCHSLVAFGEKLYAIGGYDSEKMVASMEIYDPRIGSWMMDKQMQSARGYAATAVLGDSLFAIGGVKDTNSIVETVECFKEGSEWTTSGWKAIGKRCFCSAIVL